MIHNILNIKAAVTYVPYQDLESKFMLAGLLDHPNDCLNEIRRYSYSLISQMTFGYRCPEYSDSRFQELFVVRTTQRYRRQLELKKLILSAEL
jgi:hypothetical protein